MEVVHLLVTSTLEFQRNRLRGYANAAADQESSDEAYLKIKAFHFYTVSINCKPQSTVWIIPLHIFLTNFKLLLGKVSLCSSLDKELWTLLHIQYP